MAPAGVIIAGGNTAGKRDRCAVKRWKVGETNGTVIAGTAGRSGSSATQLNTPMGITLDQWNNLYVTENTGSAVRRFGKY